MSDVEVDRRVFGPSFNESYLKWFDGIFDAVYIALHPFCKIAGMNPAEAPRSVVNVDGSELPQELLSISIIKAVQELNANRTSFDLQTAKMREKLEGEIVSWESVRVGCGLGSIAEVNHALLTIIRAVRNENANDVAAEKLLDYCKGHMIFLPSEDSFPPILERQIADLLKLLSSEQVIVSEDTRTKSTTIDTELLDCDEPWSESELMNFIPSLIYPPDHKFMLEVQFDTFFTAICGNRESLEPLVLSARLEGFWCTPLTKPNWWKPYPAT